MKTKYTKKQIQESIKHWQKVLERLNESADEEIDVAFKSSCAKALKKIQDAIADLEVVHTNKSFDKMSTGFKKDVDEIIGLSKSVEVLLAACE